MNPEVTQMINSVRSREMREQAAAWRRAREARSTPRIRSVRIPFLAATRFAMSASSRPGQTQVHGPAAA